MHKYYTPKSPIFQAVLSIFTIFVNYADFYVNMVMLTAATTAESSFVIFDDFSRCGVAVAYAILNIVFAGFPA